MREKNLSVNQVKGDCHGWKSPKNYSVNKIFTIAAYRRGLNAQAYFPTIKTHQTMQHHRMLLVTCLFAWGTIALTSCSRSPHQIIAEQIQQDIITNGGTSLKTVTCPATANPKAEQGFECVGEMDNGYTFTIAVFPKEENKLIWNVPHAKGLINIPALEATIQATLTAEIGKQLTISCGGVYKAIQPGEKFDCQVTYKLTKPAPKLTKPIKGKPSKSEPPIEITQTEKVTISTDENGDISWQRFLPGLAARG